MCLVTCYCPRYPSVPSRPTLPASYFASSLSNTRYVFQISKNKDIFSRLSTSLPERMKILTPSSTINGGDDNDDDKEDFGRNDIPKWRRGLLSVWRGIDWDSSIWENFLRKKSLFEKASTDSTVALKPRKIPFVCHEWHSYMLCRESLESTPDLPEKPILILISIGKISGHW